MRSVSITSFVILTIVSLGNVSADQKVKKRENVDRLAMGVWYRHLRTIHAVDDTFLHTFEIKIMPPTDFAHHIPPCTGNIATVEHQRLCTTYGDYVSSLRNISRTTTSYLYQLLHRINETIPHQPLEPARLGRRSLAPVVGEGLSWLFGLSTDSDLKTIRDHINHLAANEATAINQFRKASAHFSAYMRLEDNKVNQLRQAIYAQTSELASISTAIVESASVQKHILNIFIRAVYAQLHTLISYEALYFGLEELSTGRLSHRIIPSEALQACLGHINMELADRNSRQKLIYRKVHDYYVPGRIRFLYFRSDGHIYITIHFPLTVSELAFHLYKVELVPMAVNNDTKHATMLSEKGKYFAISENRDTYKIIYDENIHNIETELLQVSVVSQKPHCLVHIYLDQVIQANELCEHNILLNGLTPNVKILERPLVLITMADTITLVGPDRTQKVLNGCLQCILTVPAGHTLEASGEIVKEQHTNWVGNNDTTVVYPVNMAVLYALVGVDAVKDLSMMSHRSIQPIIELPRITHFNNTWRHQLADTTQTELNLKKVMELANNDKIVFNSLADILAQDTQTVEEWYQSTPGYVLMSMMGAIAILITTSAMLVWKQHKTAAMVAVIIRQSRGAKAEEAIREDSIGQGPRLVFLRTTTQAVTQPSLQDIILAAIQWRDLVLYIIGGVVLILSLCMLIKCCIRCYQRMMYTVSIRLTDGRETATIDLIKLKGKKYHVHFINGPEEIRVKPKLFSAVSVYWPTIQIVSMLDRHQFETIEFRRRFHIGRKTALKLQRILRNTFICQPVMIHMGKTMMIERCIENCTLIPSLLQPSAPPAEEGVRLSTLLNAAN